MVYLFMAEPDFNLMLELAKDTNHRVRRLEEDVRDVKVRMTAVEHGQAGIHSRLDRLEDRIDRIENRIGLSETEQ